MGQVGLFLWLVGFATKLILVLPYPVKAILKGQEQNDKIFEHRDYKRKYWWWDHQPFIGDNYHDNNFPVNADFGVFLHDWLGSMNLYQKDFVLIQKPS